MNNWNIYSKNYERKRIGGWELGKNEIIILIWKDVARETMRKRMDFILLGIRHCPINKMLNVKKKHVFSLYNQHSTTQVYKVITGDESLIYCYTPISKIKVKRDRNVRIWMFGSNALGIPFFAYKQCENIFKKDELRPYS